MTTVPFITRVVLQNYRSIRYCDVALGPLTYLVGPNGSGKSNFLDALHFVSDALTTSLEQALEARGGFADVRRRGTGSVGLRIEFNLGNEQGHYTFQISDEQDPRSPDKSTTGPRRVEVTNEQCELGSGNHRRFFTVRRGKVVDSSEGPTQELVPDRLALVSLSGFRALRPIYDALTSMGFYNFEPKLMRKMQRPQERRLLKPSGENLPSVLRHIESSPSDALARVREYLRAIVPTIRSFHRVPIGAMETVEFLQTATDNETWHFLADGMSDGTLRALGVLVALFQQGDDEQPPRLVGIEEPETAFHPAASAVLRDAFTRASANSQILVTSHSPDLLDDEQIQPGQLLAVVTDACETKIAAVDKASSDTIRKHLFSAGELLRLGQLVPDVESLERSATAPLFSTTN